MAKFRYEWFLFDYKKGYPDRVSKPFKTKAAADKPRGKYPPKVRGGIGVGISQIPVTTGKRKPKRRSFHLINAVTSQDLGPGNLTGKATYRELAEPQDFW